MFYLATIWLVSWTFSPIGTRTLDDTQRLYDHFANSTRHKHVRPIFNQSNPIQVSIQHVLTAVEGLDISRSTIETTGYVVLSWMDELLRWDPDLYGDIQKVHLPDGAHLKPELVVYGILEENQSFYQDDSSASFIFANGLVLIFVTATLKTRCRMDTSLFPLDHHTCTFEFYSVKHEIEELVLTSPSDYVQKFNFIENFEWEVIENSTRVIITGDAGAMLLTNKYETRLVVKRRSTFIIIHQFIPCALLMVLNLFTCLVPLNSGERLSYSVTISLAFVFLMNTVTDGIPVNSLSVSIASYTFMFVNVTNFFTVIFSVLFVRMTTWDSSKVKIPGVLKAYVRWTRKSNRVSDDANINVNQAGEQKSTTGCPVSGSQSTTDYRLQDIDADNKQAFPNDEDVVLPRAALPRDGSNDEKPEQTVSWTDVAIELDSLFFKVLLTLIISLTISLSVVLWKKSAF